MDNYDREWERLEQELADAIEDGDLAGQAYIKELMRDLRSEAAEREQWEQQGESNGWR